MDQVIMPEILTPKLVDMFASNPDMLKMLVANQPEEEVIVGKNCSIDCNSNPTNVKLVFCNVTLSTNDTEDECSKGSSTAKTEKQIGNCHIKIGSSEHVYEGSHWGIEINEASQLKLEAAALEARIEENRKILALIPRQTCNRKLVARCKKYIQEAEEQLASKKKEIQEEEVQLAFKKKYIQEEEVQLASDKEHIQEAEEQSASDKENKESGDWLTGFWKE